MNKTPVFIGFDVEDPINPEADDTLLKLARIYRQAGIPACFFMAGQKARVLRERGRKDVLEALKGHEICYHGNYWFEYPERALVYGNEDAWDLAVQKARAIETPGLNDVAEICGQFPVATVQHQNNYSPATTFAMQQAGVKAWNGGLGAPNPGFSWILGLLVAGRNSRTISGQGSWGGFQKDPARPGRRPRKMDPKKELKAFQETFDAQLEKGHSHLNILGHPTCWAMAEWWGWYDWTVPMQGPEGSIRPGPFPHGRRWERAVPRTAADRDAHLKWTADAAQWLAKRKDIRVMKFEELYSDYHEEPGQWLTAAQVRQLAKRILQRFDCIVLGKTSLSAADALVGLAQFVDYLHRYGNWPTHIQIRRTIGPVEKILVPEAPLTFSRQNLLLGARLVMDSVNAHGRIPATIRAHRVDCGPAEMLLALARAVSSNPLPESVSVEPTTGVPACAEIDCFARASAASSQAPAGYQPAQIHWQGLQQSWSYRPAVKRQ